MFINNYIHNYQKLYFDKKIKERKSIYIILKFLFLLYKLLTSFQVKDEYTLQIIFKNCWPEKYTQAYVTREGIWRR